MRGKQVCDWFVWDILQGVGLAQEVWVRGKQVCDWFVWDKLQGVGLAQEVWLATGYLS